MKNIVIAPSHIVSVLWYKSLWFYSTSPSIFLYYAKDSISASKCYSMILHHRYAFLFLLYKRPVLIFFMHTVGEHVFSPLIFLILMHISSLTNLHMFQISVCCVMYPLSLELFSFSVYWEGIYHPFVLYIWGDDLIHDLMKASLFVSLILFQFSFCPLYLILKLSIYFFFTFILFCNLLYWT